MPEWVNPAVASAVALVGGWATAWWGTCQCVRTENSRLKKELKQAQGTIKEINDNLTKHGVALMTEEIETMCRTIGWCPGKDGTR